MIVEMTPSLYINPEDVESIHETESNIYQIKRTVVTMKSGAQHVFERTAIDDVKNRLFPWSSK